MGFFRLHNGWGYLFTRDGVEMWSFVDQRRYFVKGLSNTLKTIMEGLRGGQTEEQLQRLSIQLGVPYEVVMNLVHRLRAIGAVVKVRHYETLLDSSDSLYERQIEFFSFYESDSMSAVQLNSRLQNRKILVVGIGGMGSWVVLYLSRIGVKNIVVIDPDVVEESNLSRQILYRRDDIGKYKVDVAQERIHDIDEDIRFEGHKVQINGIEDLIPYLNGVDLVINPFGFVPSRIRDTIGRACVIAGVPSLIFGSNIIGPLCIPGKTPCYACMIQGNQDLKKALDTVVENRWEPPRGPFAPLVAVSAAFAVWEATRFLSGCASADTLHGYYALDSIGFRIEFSHVNRIEDCPVCGTRGVETWRTLTQSRA